MKDFIFYRHDEEFESVFIFEFSGICEIFALNFGIFVKQTALLLRVLIEKLRGSKEQTKSGKNTHENPNLHVPSPLHIQNKHSRKKPARHRLPRETQSTEAKSDHDESELSKLLRVL